MIAEQDGVDLLVGAMEHIVKRLHRTDIACLIIGDGPEAGRLRRSQANLGSPTMSNLPVTFRAMRFPHQAGGLRYRSCAVPRASVAQGGYSDRCTPKE
jgi:hypothetical protein